MSKKLMAVLAVAVLMVPFVALADAEEDDADFEGVIDILEAIVEEPIEFEFTDDHGENMEMIKDKIKQIAASTEYEVTDETIESAIKNLFSIPVNSVLGDDAEVIDYRIGAGSMKLALDVPAFLFGILDSDSESPIEVILNSVGEIGILMDFPVKLDVRINETITQVGSPELDLSGIGGTGILEKVISIDNVNTLEGVETTISEGSIYNVDLRPSLAIYLAAGVLAATDIVSQHSFFVNLDLAAKGGFNMEMEKESGTGPEKISSGINVNSMAIEAGLGFNGVGGEDDSSLTLGIDKLKVDLSYGLGIDGKENKCTIRNSGLMGIVNGASITFSGSTFAGLHIDTSNITVIAGGTDEHPRTPAMEEIISKAKSDTAAQPYEYGKVQYIAGGVLAILGLIIIIFVSKAKGY